MFENYPDIMSVKQVSEALCIGINSAYKLIKNKSIGSRRVGRKILVPKSCVIDYAEAARYTVINNTGLLSARKEEFVDRKPAAKKW